MLFYQFYAITRKEMYAYTWRLGKSKGNSESELRRERERDRGRKERGRELRERRE